MLKADDYRRQTEHQVHLGFHASWADRGDQFRNQFVPPYVDIEPINALSVIYEPPAIELAGPMAPQSGLGSCDHDPGISSCR